MDCFEANTFSFNETVKDTFHNILIKNKLMNSTFWRKAAGSVFMGNCYTFTYKEQYIFDF